MQSGLPFNIVWFVLPLLALTAGLGLLAMLSPQRFARLSQGSSHWVDTNKLVEKIDQPIDIDSFVLRHSRIFGASVIAGSIFLAYVFFVRL